LDGAAEGAQTEAMARSSRGAGVVLAGTDGEGSIPAGDYASVRELIHVREERCLTDV